MVKKRKKEEKISRLAKLIEKKQLSPKEIKEVLEQVKHPKAKMQEIDLSKHLKNGHIRFGVVSDTQLNSKYARINDILPTLYKHFKKEKADFVVHCGDMTDGCLHRGKPVNEMLFVSDLDILHHVIENYPKVHGLTTYFIGGNEDMKFITKRKTGRKKDIGELIQKGMKYLGIKGRDDLVYLGMTEANIKLAPKTTLKLLHPLPTMGSRKPYTISYPLQQIIDKFSGGEKPDIMCVGYYHRIYNLVWRDVQAFLAGTTQNQTPDMRARQLGSDVGAWFLDVHVNKKGELKHIDAEMLPFYK